MVTHRSMTHRPAATRVFSYSALFLALIAAILALAPAAHAASIDVVDGEVAIAANNSCSLIEAIINANNNAATHTDCTAGSGADVINLPAASTFTLTTSLGYFDGETGTPVISSPITIEGNGSTITRGGGNTLRLLTVNSSGNLTLNDLTLSNGLSGGGPGGGAVYNAGVLTINDSVLSGNNGSNSQGGGAIHANGGTTSINNSTVTNNQSSGSGGGGGLFANNGATVIVNESTFNGNSASGTAGGGIAASYSGANNITLTNVTLSGNSANSGGGLQIGAGTGTLNNVTITGNTAGGGSGGGIYNQGTITLNRSLVAGNFGPVGYDSGHEILSYGSEVTNNYNVLGHSGISNGVAFANTVVIGASDVTATSNGTLPTAIGAILNTTLATNGGPTQTHALVSGSPAIDRGPSAACTAAPVDGIDQRGASRNQNGAGAVTANECDSGAFEFTPPVGTIVIVKDATPADDTPFSFTEDITDGGGTFTLTDPADDTETFSNVPAGSYTVTEDGETGWTLDDITCVDATNDTTTDVSGGTAVIALAAGETVTCTYSNSRDTGTIVIVKEATPADDTPFSFAEDISSGGGTFTLTDPADNTETFSNVPTGGYTVTEDGEIGWTLDSISCDDANSTGDTGTGAASINLEDGETVTCTFYNSQIPPAPGDLYVSARTAGTTDDGLAFGPEDVLRYDGTEWSLFFDGTSHGLMNNGAAKHNINAFWLPDPDDDDVDDEDAVMSFGQNARHVPGITGKVDGMDLVWYDADSNSFSLWFDGNDVDLTNKTQEKIDSLHVLPGGGPCLYNLLISTQGPGRVSNPGDPAIIFSGEDVLGFCATSLGENTDGLWSLVLDGSAQGMPKNSTTSISVSDDLSTMYLTTRSTFAVDSAVGGHSMVYAYDFGTEEFSGPFFIAADAGLHQTVNGLHVVSLPE